MNYLDGDDLPPELETTPLVRGRPVVVLRTDSPLAGTRRCAPPTCSPSR